MKKFALTFSTIIISLLLLVSILSVAYFHSIGQNISGSVLRMHIIAQSDSYRDVNVKLKVRDRVLNECGYIFSGCKNATQSIDIARKNSNLIYNAAKSELIKNRVLAIPRVEIGIRNFPTKYYGAIRLPAGKYTAINIKIGTASGHNWWCVMYPPLCLNSGTVSANKKTMEMLKEELTAQEYALITQSEDLKINVKFKLTEILGILYK